MDELGQVRLRDPDVPADLVKRDPPLRDQPADEPLGRVQVLGSLLDRVQPVHCAPPAGSGVSQTHAADGTSPGSTQRVPKRIATRRNARIPNTPKDPRTITYGGFGPCRATPSLQGCGWPGPVLVFGQSVVCVPRSRATGSCPVRSRRLQCGGVRGMVDVVAPARSSCVRIRASATGSLDRWARLGKITSGGPSSRPSSTPRMSSSAAQPGRIHAVSGTPLSTNTSSGLSPSVAQ